MFCFISTSEAKDVYGFMTGNGHTQEVPIGMYKFDLSGVEKPQLLNGLTFQFWGGAYAEGFYYLMLSDDYQGYISNGLCRYKLETGELELNYAYQDYLCTDMTYDYSTQTMYAIIHKYYGEDIQHQLVAINLQNGEATKVAVLEDRFFALACNYYGELYAVNSASKLYRMDKNNGAVTLIGDTGIRTDNSQAQSMEFDRETNALYWSGLDAEQNAFFIKLNPKNAAVESKVNLEYNSLIVGLHIPFMAAADDAPEKPADFQIKAVANGALLSWLNPVKAYNGESLQTELSKIEISREGELVHTVYSPEAGKKMTWTDTEAAELDGLVRYVVCAYNEAGKGDCASAVVRLGEDIPAKVSDLIVTNSDGKAVLTWKAPQAGKNGGMLKPENLFYKVTRTYDGMVFDEIKETTFTDTSIENPCFSSYRVICYNGQGESDAVESEILVVGKAIVPPYASDLTKPEYTAHWRAVDNNNDNSTWKLNAKNGEYNYFTNFFNAADDYLKSVPFKLEAGLSYVFSYSVSAESLIGSSENIRVRLCREGHEQVLENLENFSNTGFAPRNVPFTVDESGEYYFSVDALSKPDQNNIIVKDFAVDVIINKDLSLIRVEGKENVHAKRVETYQVVVANKGKESISDYLITLCSESGEKLGEKQVSGELAPAGTAIVDLEWMPLKAGKDLVTVVVSAEGDEIAANNGLKKPVYAADENQVYLELGGKDSKPGLFPIAFEGYPFSCSETIYRKSELAGKEGKIYELCYEYENASENLYDKHLKVFFKNTKQESVADGWIDESDMELVFDGNITFYRGRHLLRITLEKPFEYTADNLCVLCQKHEDTSLATIRFYAKDCAPEARTVFYESDYPEIVLSEVSGSTMLNYMEILFEECEVTTISKTLSEKRFDYDVVLEDGYLSVGNEKVKSILLVDLTGKNIASGKDVCAIAVPELQSGIYVLLIENQGEFISCKVVVE